MENPTSLGLVFVVTPGTLVRATVNRDDPTQRLPTQAISFEALPANAGIVYYGLKGFTRGTTGVLGKGQLGFLPKPASALTGPFTTGQVSCPVIAAGLNAADFWIDADNAGDGVQVTITVG
jgi:hypothetical protein